jgi:hypothetical protein
MHANGVAFANAACDACMQRECCAETVACFSRAAADCRALDACLAPCPHEMTMIGAGGDNTTGGAGDDHQGCRGSCEDAHPDSVDAQRNYHECELDHCLTECAE